MNDQNHNNNEEQEYLAPGEHSAHFVKWLALSFVLVIAVVYMAYSFGSNENQRKVNRLNQELKNYSELTSLESIVDEFETISKDIKLSNNERAKLTELLDQLVIHKTSLEQSEADLKKTKAQLQQLQDRYYDEVQQLQIDKQNLQAEVDELSEAISYKKGSVKTFTVSVFDSHQLLEDASSRVGLEKILNTGSAQINVGNTLMFFHVGNTLRFRFYPNWLCDLTLVKIDEDTNKVEFEYSCELN